MEIRDGGGVWEGMKVGELGGEREGLIGCRLCLIRVDWSLVCFWCVFCRYCLGGGWVCSEIGRWV